MSRDDVIRQLKKHQRVTGFMRKHRYTYHRTMVTDVATLAYEFYLDGYNNGLEQHPVATPQPNATDESKDE